ncbi:MAG: hypothetical protein JWQ42_3097 [Edaphobacter sp.]|nr:hypothetical protein [Edaphobacter sp.]
MKWVPEGTTSTGDFMEQKTNGWILRTLFCCGAYLIFSVSISAQQPQQKQKEQEQQQHLELPNGPGKDTLVRLCSKCHSPNQVIASGRNRQGWEDTITKMVGLGAVGTDEEFTEILDYLVKNFPPQQSSAKVNVNKATVTQLETQLAFSAKEAEAVIAYRDKNGNFKSLDDLKKVSELDAKTLDAKKDRLIF